MVNRYGRFVAATLHAIGAALLVGSILLPPARIGVASTISLHELFDLLLSGHVPFSVPKWIGLFGYVPAMSGALILLTGFLSGTLQLIFRGIGVAIAWIAAILLLLGGPWMVPSNMGSGLWMLVVGAIVVGCGLVWDVLVARAWQKAGKNKAAGYEPSAMGVSP